MPQIAQETATLTRRYRFAASHRLHTDRLSPEENARIFGKCNNPNGHGHNYIVFVTVAGTIDPTSGRVTDCDALDRVVNETVVDRFDHQDLNLDPVFEGGVTTGENLVRIMFNLLRGKISGGRLVKVGVVETRDNYFECSEETD